MLPCCVPPVAACLAWTLPPAQAKTARECAAEWTANKDKPENAGKTRAAYVAECRGLPAPAERGARQGPVQDRSRSQDLVPDRQRRVGQSALEGLPHQRRTRVTARPSAAPTCARRTRPRPVSGRRRGRKSRPRHKPACLARSHALSGRMILLSRRDGAREGMGVCCLPERHAPCHATPAAINAREGRLAQLVERLLYTQDVGGSSPSPPTSLRACGASAGKPAFVTSRCKANIRRQPRWPPTDAKEVPARQGVQDDQTASLSSFAARKATFLLALIWIGSPVAGLRPMRAARLRT